MQRFSLERPQYILFAGVNGAGKSTLYKSGLWSNKEKERELPRVNSDEILVQHSWDWSKESDQLKAGRLALGQMKDFLSATESFLQETTLAGRTIVKHIQQAHDLGYQIQMNYVGVDSADLALQRIEYRVSVGGHGITEEGVRRRYAASLENLYKVAPLCESIMLYDNTTQLRLVAFTLDGVVYNCANEQAGATWFLPVIAQLTK